MSRSSSLDGYPSTVKPSASRGINAPARTAWVSVLLAVRRCAALLRVEEHVLLELSTFPTSRVARCCRTGGGRTRCAVVVDRLA
eukprot:scaffold83217_cov40-Attheya_sp.AAC.2